MKKRLNFFKPQLDFLNSEEIIAFFLGGIGSGKTYTGANWLLREALSNNKLDYYACSNTYAQLKDVLYPKFFNVLNNYGLEENIHYIFNKSTKDLVFINGSRIMFRSLVNYNMLRGAEVAGALIDEARDAEEEAIKVILGRLRQINNAKLRITTTPAGYNWIYSWIREKKIKYFKMTTYDNTFLPESYIKLLEKQYSGDFFRQEIMADFVNFAGKLVYFAFEREKNLIDNIDFSNFEYHIGLDFNIDPFCAVVTIIKDDVIYIIDEIILRGLDINMMITEIKKRYGTNVIIYPDASGKNRNVANSLTLMQMLQNAFGYENVKYFSKNPRISDRVQTVNNYLEQEKVKIKKSCKKIIEDLEKVKFKENGAFEFDKKDKELTHISDALGYLIYYIENNKINVWKQN